MRITKKCWKKIGLTVLALCFTLSLAVGCAASSKGNGTDTPNVSVDDVAIVWNALSTEKYMQDHEMESYTEAKLDFAGMRNEVQSAQLMLTAKKKIRSFNLEASDLTAANGDTISKDKVSVYAERYVEVYNPMITNAAGYMPLAGFYPDALVPLDRYRARREDMVEKGNNQGIWVDVDVETGVNPGDYTGTFVLTVNGAKKDIPVSVKVYNLDMPVEVHNPTMIDIWYSNIGYGEGDNVDSSTFDVYYEYLLDKRLNCENLPPNYSSSIDTFVDKIPELALDPRVTIYEIPHPTITGAMLYSDAYPEEQIIAYRKSIESSLRSQLKKILDKNIEIRENPEATEEEKTIDLFKKAVYYWEDEPSGVRRRQVKMFCQLLHEAKEKLITNQSKKDKPLARHPDLIESIRGVDEMCPSDYIDFMSVSDYELCDGLTLWCPSMYKFDSESYRQQMLEKQAKGERIWWYTCVHNSPSPSYLVESIPMNIRLQAWMQYDYSIEGILYWQTCSWSYADDVYEDVQARSWGGGEGLLLYPGAKYGMKVPVSSIRLEQLRLGQQDYEYFWLLDQALTANASSVTAREFISKLGEGLYTGTTVKAEASERDFETCRIKVLEVLEMFANDNAEGALQIVNTTVNG